MWLVIVGKRARIGNLTMSPVSVIGGMYGIERCQFDRPSLPRCSQNLFVWCFSSRIRHHDPPFPQDTPENWPTPRPNARHEPWSCGVDLSRIKPRAPSPDELLSLFTIHLPASCTSYHEIPTHRHHLDSRHCRHGSAR